MSQDNTFKSGFANIIGRPNVGKSTLLNTLIGEKLFIVSPKPQTTRHRILGILSDENFQIVLSDTPGIIEQPKYKMHEKMNQLVEGSFEDADVFIFVVHIGDRYLPEDAIFSKFQRSEIPVILALNKIDLSQQKEIEEEIQYYQSIYPFYKIIPISALHRFQTDTLVQTVVDLLPENPPYFPEDFLSDKNERFFASEIIREKILYLYDEEVPYSCEVVIESFKEGTTKNKGDIIRISATIFVMRETQKAIIIGQGGRMIKKLGIEARKELEMFFQKNIFLELNVKVKDNWRDNEQYLKNFGYT